MSRRLHTIPLQLAFVVLGLLGASVAAPRFDLIPSFVLKGTKNVALSWSELGSVVLVFVTYHLLAGVAARGLSSTSPLAEPRRALVELFWVAGATSVASCHMFLFSLIPFVPNFYAWAFLLVPGLHAVAFLSASRRWEQRLSRETALELRPLVLSRWAALTCGVVVAPGILAVGYKKVPTFADLVNYTRVSLNLEIDGGFELVDAYPGLRLEQPMDVGFDPLAPEVAYVLERPGKLVRVRPGAADAPEVLLDISEEVGSTRVESGALSFALHPEFGRAGSPGAGRVYVYYTHWGPETQHNRLASFDLSQPTAAARAASRELLIDQRRTPSGYHNGGTVRFGPDGFLYLSVGEASTEEGRQQIDRYLLGGILRIDVDRRGGDVSAPIRNQPLGGATRGYFIPRDNPFAGRPSALEEFWVLGLRNPFRFSIDAPTGELWVGDLGSDEWEEINRFGGGENGQYPYLEATQPTWHARPDGAVIGEETPPFWAYRQTALDRAVIGGVLYRGDAHPRLRGSYLFADNQSGLLKALDPEDTERGARVLARTDQLGQQGITSVRVGPAGALFVTVLGGKGSGSGRLLRLDVRHDAVTAPSAAPSAATDTVGAKFDMLCARCHGLDGRGEPTGAVAGLNALRPDFTRADWQARTSDERIERVIRQGGAALGLSPEMPAWEGAFTEAELRHLTAKIRAFAETEQASNATDER